MSEKPPEAPRLLSFEHLGNGIYSLEVAHPPEVPCDVSLHVGETVYTPNMVFPSAADVSFASFALDLGVTETPRVSINGYFWGTEA
ncbi:MAG: hypothetical protein ACO1RX_13545 [Candidatus Sericytochromatia bacterium]